MAPSSSPASSYRGPQIIALCGDPDCGKSTVQKVLERVYGCVTVDDGRPLRDAAKTLYGLSEEQVTTQEGKASVVDICGTPKKVADLLGEMGVWLEAQFGPDFLPWASYRAARAKYGAPVSAFVFGSARREQTLSYRQMGGAVIEIVRPGHVPSRPVMPYDRYNQAGVTHRLVNDGTLEDLQHKARQLAEELARFVPSAVATAVNTSGDTETPTP